MKIKYKIAKDKDFDKFLNHFKNTLSENFPFYSKNSIDYTIDVDYSREFLETKLHKEEKILFLAMEENNIAGYLLIMKQIAGVGYADWLAVNKKYRGQGIASKLLEMWEKHAINDGAHALFLWTTIANIKFYKNRGFVLGGEFPKAWHGVNTYLIYKILREPKEENFLKEYLKSKNDK